MNPEDRERIEAIRARLNLEGGFVGERANIERLLDLVERQQREIEALRDTREAERAKGTRFLEPPEPVTEADREHGREILRRLEAVSDA